MERFGCSRQATDTAYRMMFADGTVAAMFSADEITPSPAGLPDRIRYLKVAALAVLTADGDQSGNSTVSRAGPSRAETRNGSTLSSPTTQVSTASKSPAAATSVTTAVCEDRSLDGPA